MEHLFDNLSAQLSNHLLFLRSVTAIELYRCPTGERVPVLIRRAVATVSNRNTLNDQTLMRYFDKKHFVAEKDSSNTAGYDRDKFYDTLAYTKDEKLPTTLCTVTISVIDADNKSLEKVEYFVISGLRGGTAKASACDPQRRHLKLVPVCSCSLFYH